MAKTVYAAVLFSLIASVIANHDNSTCTYKKSSLVVTNVIAPATMTTSRGVDSVESCKQRCCDSGSDKCNKISYFKYKSKWRCVLASCIPLDNCITTPYPSSISYDVARPGDHETTTVAPIDVTSESTGMANDVDNTTSAPNDTAQFEGADEQNITLYNETYKKVMEDFENVTSVDNTKAYSTDNATFNTANAGDTTTAKTSDDDFWWQYQQELEKNSPAYEETTVNENPDVEIVTLSPDEEKEWNKIWADIIDEEEHEIESIFGEPVTNSPFDNGINNNDISRPNTATDSNATSNYMNYMDYDDTIMMILGGVATVLFVVLLLVCVALRIHSKKERARYRPLKEDFDGSSNYHDEYTS